MQIVFTFYGALQLHWCRFGKVFLSVELRILRSSTHSSGLIIDFIYSTYNSLLDYYIIGNSGHCWSSWTIIDCGVVSFKYEWWSQQQSLISGLPALPCPLRLQKLEYRLLLSGISRRQSAADLRRTLINDDIDESTVLLVYQFLNEI